MYMLCSRLRILCLSLLWCSAIVTGALAEVAGRSQGFAGRDEARGSRIPAEDDRHSGADQVGSGMKVEMFGSGCLPISLKGVLDLILLLPDWQ
jgi:hypothetical protein